MLMLVSRSDPARKGRKPLATGASCATTWNEVGGIGVFFTTQTGPVGRALAYAAGFGAGMTTEFVFRRTAGQA
jgi:hypothetical protein